MVKRSRSHQSAEATRRNLEQLGRLGGELRRARLARRLTQEQVARSVGVGRSTLSDLERGRGGGHTLDSWQRLALAVGRPLRWELERDRLGETADAGHLAVQELVLRITKAAGWLGTFELPVRPAASRHAIDVGLRHQANPVMALVECWNVIEDLGSAARSSAWKLGRAAEAAIAFQAPGAARPPRVGGCWVVRALPRNRALVARYPEILAARFPGSSVGWIRSLTTGDLPPVEPGLVWCDAGASRLYPWRRRG